MNVNGSRDRIGSSSLVGSVSPMGHSDSNKENVDRLLGFNQSASHQSQYDNGVFQPMTGGHTLFPHIPHMVNPSGHMMNPLFNHSGGDCLSLMKTKNVDRKGAKESAPITPERKLRLYGGISTRVSIWGYQRGHRWLLS